MNNKISKEWIFKIIPHSLWPLLILTVSWYTYIVVGHWVALPVLCSLINLYSEIKEEEGKLKSQGVETGTLKSIYKAFVSQVSTTKQQSEWLWTGTLSGLLLSMFYVLL